MVILHFSFVHKLIKLQYSSSTGFTEVHDFGIARKFPHPFCDIFFLFSKFAITDQALNFIIFNRLKSTQIKHLALLFLTDKKSARFGYNKNSHFILYIFYLHLNLMIKNLYQLLQNYQKKTPSQSPFCYAIAHVLTGLQQSIFQQNFSTESNKNILNSKLFFNITIKYPVWKKNHKADQNIF